MKIFRRLSFPGVLTAVTLIVVVGLAMDASAYKSRSSRKNNVVVKVRPMQLVPGQPAKFEVIMNTHSVDLSHDMVAVSTLTDDRGREYKPLNWNGAPPGSHHRSGVLNFPTIEGSPETITLVISDVARVPERIFKWKLEQ